MTIQTLALRWALAIFAVLAVALTAGCSTPEACPRLSSNPDGSFTIAAPSPSSDPDRCEYEFDGQDLTTERDND